MSNSILADLVRLKASWFTNHEVIVLYEQLLDEDVCDELQIEHRDGQRLYDALAKGKMSVKDLPVLIVCESEYREYRNNNMLDLLW